MGWQSGGFRVRGAGVEERRRKAEGGRRRRMEEGDEGGNVGQWRPTRHQTKRNKKRVLPNR